MDSQKKVYETPVLAVLGDVEEMTQNIFSPGTGDILSQIIDQESGCTRLNLFCNTGS